MKNYKLKPHFSVKIGKDVIVGPAEIQLDDEQAELEKHKIEMIVAEEPKKKAKKAKEEGEE